MIRTKLAKSVLNKKEQRHLTEVGINSMKQFLEVRKCQIRMEARDRKKGLPPGIAIPCYECVHIARKLGVD